MKNYLKIGIVFLAVSTLFTACKKDSVDLEDSYMDLIVSEEGVWAAENEIRYVANLSPGSLSGDKVTVTYTSEADPEGFSVEAAYWNDELTFGRDVYKVQKIDRNFYASTQTNAEEERLKVNPDGDKITITIGDNVFSETVDFVKQYDPLLVADITQGVSGGLGGDIQYYNENGERPAITAYTDSNPTPVTLTPNSDLGDDGYLESDLEILRDFGYTSYSISLIFRPDEASGWDYEVNANKESDVLYIEIGDKTYSMPIDGEDRYYKIPLSPAK